MDLPFKRWIYVTGAPRSGTTFVGRILSAGVRMDYIHEPFNPDCGIPGVDEPYLYLEENETREIALRPEIERLLRYESHLKTGYYPNDTSFRRMAKRFVGSRGPFYMRLARINPLHEGAVIKDPMGCLLTEYMLLRYQMKPVVVIRNPLGFAASARRLNWDLSLTPLLNQPRLAERFFESSDMRAAYQYENGTPLQRAAVLWRLLNRVLLAMADAHPEILVVTHEEISERPLETFERIYAHTGLSFDESVRKRVLKLTSGNRAHARPGKVQDFRRDSRRIREGEKAYLSASDITEVFSITAPVADLQYSREALSA